MTWGRVRIRPAALLALALLAGAGSAGAICMASRPPRVIEAEVRACRPPEEAIRQALEPYREAHEKWLDNMPMPEEWRQSRSFDRMVESTLARNPGLILTLELRRYRQLSADPNQKEEVEIGPWEPIEESKPRERDYFLRAQDLTCDDLAGTEPRLFLEDPGCCDVIPSSDAACLLKLPALVPLSPELEEEATATSS